MQEIEFSKLIEQVFFLIIDTIENQDEDGLIDIDFHGDILNLITDKGVFVINKHSAIQEIWLASPISGAYHFRYIDNQWKSKANLELFLILERELSIKFDYTAI